MDFNPGRFKQHLRFLNKLGRRSLLAGAVAITGIALRSKFKTSGDSVSASSQYVDKSPWDSNWDRRNVLLRGDPTKINDSKITQSKAQRQQLQENVSIAKRHILLIRHGQYKEEEMSDKDRSLTDVGRYQATVTGQRLQKLNLPYTRMMASTMTRAQETAELIREKLQLPYLELEYDNVLEEGAPVKPEPPTVNWRPHPCQFYQDGARIENAFRKYFHRADPDQKFDSYEMIVCHSNVIRYFVCRALQFPMDGWIRFSLANCSLTMITIHPDGLVVIEMLGDHGHIPVENVTYH